VEALTTLLYSLGPSRRRAGLYRPWRANRANHIGREAREARKWVLRIGVEDGAQMPLANLK